MNKVILMGRLTRDPDVRYSAGDNSTAVARYTLAVDRRFSRREDNGNGQIADKWIQEHGISLKYLFVIHIVQVCSHAFGYRYLDIYCPHMITAFSFGRFLLTKRRIASGFFST